MLSSIMSLKMSIKLGISSINFVTTQSRDKYVPLPTRTMIQNRNIVAVHDCLKYPFDNTTHM